MSDISCRVTPSGDLLARARSLLRPGVYQLVGGGSVTVVASFVSDGRAMAVVEVGFPPRQWVRPVRDLAAWLPLEAFTEPAPPSGDGLAAVSAAGGAPAGSAPAGAAAVGSAAVGGQVAARADGPVGAPVPDPCHPGRLAVGVRERAPGVWERVLPEFPDPDPLAVFDTT